MTLNRARSNLAQAKSPHPLSPDAGTGLLVSSRLGFVTERIPECKSAPYWKGARTGFGAYSEVFRIQEHVHHDTDVFTRTPLSRTLVAKVFRDSAPNDYEAVYASELRTLLALGHHERIVELRGAADNMPPTFVCGHIDCGQVFQIECCPQCSQPLRNGDSNETILLCGGGHRYQKYNPDHLRSLTHPRPCQHQDECTPINFLFRPYIFLEELTYDLRTVNDLISTPPSQQPRGAPFSFDSKPENEERRSETLLFRLDTLIGIAEGLAFLHAQGCLHADIAPENAMIRLRMDIDGVGITTNSPTTKLIDFGLAKRVEDNRTSTTVVGRITFLAPEQMVAQGSLGPKVSIRFKNGHPQEGEFCQLSTVNGDDLPFERRDFLRDVEDGQYEVLADNEVPNEVFAQFGDVGPQEVKLEKVRPLYGRVLKPPLTGRDAAQTTLRFSYALDVPMDIFSLGCLVAWSITGGQEDLVHLLREQASVATRRKEVVGQNFCSTLLGDDYRKIANAIDLPRTPEDDEIRAALLDVVCRALIRSEGAYCRRRSSGYSQPAAALAADLKRIRNLMFLMVHTKERFLRQTQQRAATEVARMNRLSEDVDSLSADLSRKDTQLSSVAQKSALWRAGAVLSASVALCLAVALRMAATPSAGPTVEIADQPLVANRSPSDASLLEPPQPEQPPQLIATVQPRTTSLSEFPSAKPPQPERAIVSTPDSVSPDSSAVQPTERIRRSAPVGPRRTAKVGGLPMSNSTVEQIAQQAIDRTAECKAKPSSLKVDGTVTVNFNADASTGKVKKVSIVDVSDDDLRIDEKKCRDLLEGLDFRAASDISEDFKVSLRITKGG